jgi:hypothetical protein
MGIDRLLTTSTYSTKLTIPSMKGRSDEETTNGSESQSSDQVKWFGFLSRYIGTQHLASNITALCMFYTKRYHVNFLFFEAIKQVHE